MKIRPATPADIPAITRICGASVLNGTAGLIIERPSLMPGRFLSLDLSPLVVRF